MLILEATIDAIIKKANKNARTLILIHKRFTSTSRSATGLFGTELYQPGSKLSEYYHAYMNTDLCKNLFCQNTSVLHEIGQTQSTNCKSQILKY